MQWQIMEIGTQTKMKQIYAHVDTRSIYTSTHVHIHMHICIHACILHDIPLERIKMLL